MSTKSKKNKRKAKRMPLPNGEDQNAYKNFVKWPKRRWAWEFLRRNPKFQAACKELDTLDEADAKKRKRKEIRIQFHLRFFKHAEERYGRGPQRPVFTPTAAWKVEEDKNTRDVTVKLEEAHCLVRFDVRPMLLTNSSFKYQFKQAKSAIELTMEDYLRRHPGQAAEKFSWKGSELPMIQLLRLLDMKAAGQTNKSEAYRKIFVPDDDELSNETAKKSFNAYKRAESIADHRYLALALYEGELPEQDPGKHDAS
ncbi:transcriptional regulator domain-containing protein [Pigmentiphaga sp. D-2]|uniref:transcriptional regulator domain-containing protein n=1 Tax=Pigmentiphaga sp. D-2 TaxID=1002116 RepID=UPI001044D21B|nr:DUF6499 domain-containing protein [Pigmentiphaga sp. D-2]